MMPGVSSTTSSTNDEPLVAFARRRTSDGIKSSTLRAANRSVRISTLNGDEQRSTIKMSSTSVLPSVDPNVFIQAGTSGLRHLLPIHLNESNLTRPIVRLRSRTPKTSRSTNTDVIRHICSTIETLQQFDISDNTLEELPIELCRLIDLEKLNCANNRLTTMSNEFEQLKNLKELNLSYNIFKRLPAVIATFSKLIKLNVEENSLKIIDVPFTNLRLLKTLVLDNNQIQSIDSIDFQDLIHLESLHIAHNQLTKFPRNLHRLTHLKIVDLSSNQLSSFPIELLLINSLDVLNLSHNRIRKLPPLNDVYKRKTLLFSIDFSHNQLFKFYDYLLLICRKLDLSFNQIQSIPSNILDKFSEEMLNERELKIYQNPLLNTNAPADLRHEMNNVLPFIQQFFHELQNTDIVRQGFQICITGPKGSGKSALTYSLQENLPYVPEEELDNKQERIVDVHQFAFSINEIAPTNSSTPTKPRETSRKLLEKRQMAKTPTLSTTQQNETHRLLPVTIFDLNGSLNYFPHVSQFVRTKPMHLICVHSLEFSRQAPEDIEDVFNGKISIEPSSMLGELLQLLQYICDQATRTNPLMIIPVATCTDLYEKEIKTMKTINGKIVSFSQILAKMNQFFQLFFQKRLEYFKNEIESIERLPMISASFSDRLKCLMSKFQTNIHIELCQSVSSVTFQGIAELHQTIGKCVLTHKHLFPHVDRILPRLWADTNQYFESLADYLPVPFLSWESYREHLIEKNGLSNLVDEITLSLKDQGKILVLNELGTKEKVVFLRPLWLADLLSSIFCSPMSNDDDHPQGILRSSSLRTLWNNLLHKDEYFPSICFILMRFLLFAYPKVNPRQLRTLFHSNDIHFDQIVLPFLLPMIDPIDRDLLMKDVNSNSITSISISYRSSMFPFGLFHQYSVLLLFRTSIIYDQHANNFLLGHHDDHQLKFIIETDHQTYVNIHCTTNHLVDPLDHIWRLVLQFIHHFELLIDDLSPNHQFQRFVRCPKCFDYSFMGEWNTPKDLQNSKIKSCSSCLQPIETNFLIQPNETRRRNEQILEKIRQRNSTPMKK